MSHVGIGYDSHRFAASRPLILGGVRLREHDGLAGHSDADAVLHAVADAILGAMAAGDIGELFPDTDPKWKDADSAKLLGQVVELVARSGFVIENCDVTVIAESPKLGPHKLLMRKRIAAILGVGLDAVSVKAKTNEGMGWVGRGEGIAVMAMVSLAGGPKA